MSRYLQKHSDPFMRSSGLVELYSFDPQVMLPNKMSVVEVRRAINAIATEMYRPPWK